MLDVTLTVRLTLKGPILTQSTAAGAYGFDSAVARNAGGNCYLPGTLVKGRLRQAWEELVSVPGNLFDPPIDDLLGRATGNSESNHQNEPIEPSRGRLHFDDFIADANPKSEMLYRIRIDEQRGAVLKGAHQVIEAPYASGGLFTFSGSIHYLSPSDHEADDIKRSVELGLRWITSLGAERTVGFGVLMGVTVAEKRQKHDHPITSLSPVGMPVLDYALRPLAPFCIAKRRINDNLFESEEVISGGVLKGCFAATWRSLLGLKQDGKIDDETDAKRPELTRNFEKLHFTHAFPGFPSSMTRPTVAPLSLVKFECRDGSIEIRDIALCKGPVLLGDKSVAPSFAVDWKGDEDVQKDFGWPKLHRELRVRTSIDKARRRAKEEQLFAYEMVVPKDWLWYGRIDLSQIEDLNIRKEVENHIRDVSRLPLHSFGKTKCQAELTLHPEGTIRQCYISSLPPRDRLWIVTLQTPALLCDPAQLDETSGKRELFKSYFEVWSQLSDHSLRLVRYFAQQSLSGGFYIHRRFQPEKTYNPYLMTEPGSVFVLQAKIDQAERAQQCIERWFAQGLPLPDWAVERYGSKDLPGDHWENCPYLPANGYGEIAVNLDVHWDKQPQKGECHAV